MKNEMLRVFIFELLLTIAITVIVYVSLGATSMNYDSYYSFWGQDGTATEVVIRGIQEQGIIGLYFNERVGAPNIASFIDASGIDLFTGIVVVFINAIFKPTTGRLYYYLLYFTFLMTAYMMSYLLFKLKINPCINLVTSILFACAPFHFYRYLVHISVGNAFAVPLLILFSLFYLKVIDLKDKKEGYFVSISSFIVGIGNPYFVFFGIIHMAMAVIYKLTRDRKIKSAIDRLWILIPMIMGFILSMIPSTLYNILNGKNSVAFYRDASEAELYGLKLIQMLLPVRYSRITCFRKLTENYYDILDFNLDTENYMSSLGLVASVGFIIIAIFFIIIFVRNKEEKDYKKCVYDNELIRFISLATVGFILVGNIGGIGEIFNFFVTPQIRCYNRVSIFITCFAFVVLAHIANYYSCKKNKIVKMICICTLIIGLFDQVYIYGEDYCEYINEYNNMYASFFSEIEDRMPDNAMIYQLPYALYPENGDVYNMLEAKHFVGYLYTDNIRWSYGGIKGRDKIAQYLYIDGGMSSNFIAAIKAVGFNGVYIDTTGFEDGGLQIISFYESLGIAPIISADGTLYFFDIDGVDYVFNDVNDCPGYDFSAGWIQKYAGIDNVPLAISIAESINDLEYPNIDIIEYLYSYIEDIEAVKGLSDTDYISFIYSELLGREVSGEEKLVAIEYIKDGNDRRGVFYNIFLSDEFRRSIGVD